MLISLISLLLPLAPPPPDDLAADALAQTQEYVCAIYDGVGGQVGVNQGPGSIKKSLNDIFALSMSTNVSGYVIHLSVNNWPMNDPNGVNMAVGGGWETFPIELPPGITIKGHPILAPTSVGSWASNPTNGSFFTFVEAPNSNYSGAAKIIDLNFLGGGTALAFSTFNGGTPLSVIVKGCRFKGNNVAIDTTAADGQNYSIRIEDCVLSDSPVTTYQSIQYLRSTVGFRFKSSLNSSSSASAPHVTGEVINVSLAGQYPSSVLSPAAPLGVSTGEGSDLAGYTPPAGSPGQFTRAIEVHVQGNVSLVEFDTLSAQQPIPAVDLTVSDGLLDGSAAASTTRGWDVGIYAMAQSHGNSGGGIGNYTSRYSVEVTGTVIEDFRAAGVYVQVGEDTRGHLGMNGLAEVRWTGIQNPVQTDDVLSTGVHAVARMGHLSVVTDRAFIHDNRGNGVLCFTPGTAIGELPFGLYLKMKRTGVHRNGRSGVILDGGYGHTSYPQLQGGVVGGTRHLVDGGMSLVKHVSNPFDNLLSHYGQGTINGCAISAEGGRYGILCRVRGSSLTPNVNDTLAIFSAASCRIVNSYVWGFSLGGYYADLGKATTGALQTGPTLLTPIIHSTIVNNPAFSVDIIEQNANTVYRYYRADPVGREYLNTMIAHCVFHTMSGNFDFGSHLDPSGGTQQWTIDDGSGTGPNSHTENIDMPHVTSVRAILINGPPTGMPSYTLEVPIYQQYPAGFNPDQWYLNDESDPELLNSAGFLNAGGDIESEADADIENWGRQPLASGERDKGGEED